MGLYLYHYTHDVHGAPLGEKEAAATRESLGWRYGPFEIPATMKAAWDAAETGKAKQAKWNEQLTQYQAAFPELAKELLRCTRDELPASWTATKAQLFASMKAIEAPSASRKSSQQTLDILVPALPELLGGSADLTGSNLTAAKTSVTWHHKTDQAANYISYGVREFGMSAIMNGVALHGGYIPFGATFLTFSDYSRNALRMAALMKLRSIFVFTHDSIGLGEDGPTHQSVEQISSLRLIPHLDNWRPCDTVESAVAWAQAIKRQHGPTTLIFSRQNLAFMERTASQIAAIQRGGYVLKEVANAKAVLIATFTNLKLRLLLS